MKRLVLAACFFFLAVLLVILLFPSSTQAELQESNVGLYVEDGEDNIGYAAAYQDGRVWFNLSLENYVVEDSKDRYVVLFVDGEATLGDAARWNFQFVNPVCGYNTPCLDYNGVDYFSFFVPGNGSSSKVEIVIDHFYTREEDNQDRMEYKVRGYDFEAGTEPTDDENRTRFLQQMVDESWSAPSNISYLQESRDNTPSLDGEVLEYEITLNARVISNPGPTIWIYCSDSIVVVPGQTYTLAVNVVNNDHQNDQIKFTAKLDHSKAGYWTIEATNYNFGYEITLGSGEGELIYMEITAPVNSNQVPAGEYDLILTATSKNPRFKGIVTVKITVPQRYDPLLTVVEEDDKNAATDGSFTYYNLKLRNEGAVNDSVFLQAEVQNTTTGPPKETHPYWEFDFPGQVAVEGDGFLDIIFGMRPLLDNDKISPGKYPVKLWVVSENNTNRSSETGFIIRMPNLYNPGMTMDSQVGLDSRMIFTLINNGVVDDTMTLDFRLTVGDQTFTTANPGGWSFEFRDLDTDQSISAPYQLTLGTSPETKWQSIYLDLAPPSTVPEGFYPLEIIARSSGPVSDLVLDEWQGNSLVYPVFYPDLYILPGDISLSRDRVKEGDSVNITVRVQLDGALGLRPVTVGFYYHTTAAGFVSMGEKELDFGGATDTSQNISFTWQKTKVPFRDLNNIKVVVDPGNWIAESDETNNEALATLSVESLDEGDEEEIGLAGWTALVSWFLVCFLGGFVLLKLWVSGQKEKSKSPESVKTQFSENPSPSAAPVSLEELITMLEGTRGLLTALSSSANQPLTKDHEKSLENLELFLNRLGKLKTQMAEAVGSAEKALEESVGPKDTGRGEES